MPGIKGTAIEPLVADVNRLVQEGGISRDVLEARLTREDLEILDQKILAALWYPLATYERLTQVMLEVEGRGDLGYVVERGRKAAERLRASGIYAQLGRSRRELGDRIGRVMVTLGPAMYQDSQWSFLPEPPGSSTLYRIEATVSAGFPEVGRYAAQGFIEHLANLDAESPVRIRSERVSPTLLAFLADAP